ncbi:MAG: type II toxin-antitoxin system VapC family toxin [Acidobacteriota bacterium]
MGQLEVILFDTHVWIWWVHGDPILGALQAEIEERAGEGFAVSAISCWEVAKLVEWGRLQLPMGLDDWLNMAIDPSGVSLIALSPRIAVESTQLPGTFHRDPADQIIVATSRVHDLVLATYDQRIRGYPHVRVLDDFRIQDREISPV